MTYRAPWRLPVVVAKNGVNQWAVFDSEPSLVVVCYDGDTHTAEERARFIADAINSHKTEDPQWAE